MFRLIFCKSFYIAITVLLVTACSSGSGPATGPTPLNATAQATSGFPIGSAQAIVITFNKSMNTSTLNIGGTAGNNVASWSTTSLTDDTLTVAPQNTWNVGTGKTIIVDADSSDGKSLSTLTLSYDVLTTASLTYYYVDGDSGLITNDGLSPGSPMLTIAAAITAAAADSVVLVAGTTYQVDSTSGVNTNIVLKEGVSLYGGYNSDFTIRDVTTYLTEIVNIGTSAGVANTAIVANTGISSMTIIDGFSVTGGGGTVSSAIHTDNASPTLRNNIFNGGSGSTTYSVWLSNGSAPLVQDNTINGNAVTTASAYAMYIENSSPVVERNTIDAGTSNSNIFGIWTVAAGGVIRNNVISAGTNANGSSYGVRADGTVSILNNTINGGSGGSYSTGISYNSGAVVIENNIIFTSVADYRTCFMETQGVTNPANFDNNNLFDCPTSLYTDYVGVSGGNCPYNASFNCLTAVTDIHNLGDIGSGASGNVSVDPAFANQAGGNWHLTDSSPASIFFGGLDLSASFTDDKDSVSRTVPWSIGAYERSGPGKMLFLTPYGNTPSGDLGGIVGADAICMDVANGYPGTGTYKALIADGVNRVASVSANTGDGQVDWILLADTAYLRSDGTTLVGITDANGLLPHPLVNSIRDTTTGFWSGLNEDWTSSVNNCVNWTDNTATFQGRYGIESGLNSLNIYLVWSDAVCSATGAILVCVEQ